MALFIAETPSAVVCFEADEREPDLVGSGLVGDFIYLNLTPKAAACCVKASLVNMHV